MNLLSASEFGPMQDHRDAFVAGRPPTKLLMRQAIGTLERTRYILFPSDATSWPWPYELRVKMFGESNQRFIVADAMRLGAIDIFGCLEVAWATFFEALPGRGNNEVFSASPPYSPAELELALNDAIAKLNAGLEAPGP